MGIDAQCGVSNLGHVLSFYGKGKKEKIYGNKLLSFITLSILFLNGFEVII